MKHPIRGTFQGGFAKPSWGLLGPSWGLIGPSWAILGPSWAPLAPSSGHLALLRVLSCANGTYVQTTSADPSALRLASPSLNNLCRLLQPNPNGPSQPNPSRVGSCLNLAAQGYRKGIDFFSSIAKHDTRGHASDPYIAPLREMPL